MDFTPSTSLSLMPGTGPDSSMSCSSQSGDGNPVMPAGRSVAGNELLQNQPSTEETSDSQTSSSDSMGENLHALPL